MYEIIDNFLCKKDFLKIKNFFDSNLLTWEITKNIVGSDEGSNYKLDDYMFNHGFYRCEPFHISENIMIIFPIIKQLNIKRLIRCKANLYTRTENIIKHKYHIDQEEPHTVALYYVNSNNGSTILEDEIEVKSVENRLLIFDGKIKHASTTASDNIRMNISFNFTQNDYRNDNKLENLNYA